MESPDNLKSEIPLLDELLTGIISKFFPLCEWSRCFEPVSKQFQRCVLIAYDRTKSVNCRKLYSLTKTYQSLRNFLNFHSEVDEGENCIRLNRILEKLIAVCPNLADIAGFHFVTSNMYSSSVPWEILEQFDRLQSISLEFIKNIDFRSFAYFVENSKSLKILNLAFCIFDSGGTLDVGSINDVSFYYPFARFVPEITLENLSEKLIALTLHRNFEYCFENPREAMKNCSNLERLSVIVSSTNDCELFLNSLPSLRKLTSLCVNCLFSHDMFMDSHICYELSLLKNQLRCLEIIDGNIDGDTLHFLFREFSQLEIWKSENECSRPDDDSDSDSDSYGDSTLKNLHSLPVNFKRLTLSHKNAEILTILMPNLVNLTNFTDLAIPMYFSTERPELENIACLVNLQNLRLYGRFVDDDLLVAWDRKNAHMFEKLVSLELRYSPVSDRGAILVAKKTGNLKILDLFCSRISENTISILADVAKKLTKVDLVQWRPYLFDVNDVIGLIKNVTCLKKVNVHGELRHAIYGNENFRPFVENVEIEYVED